MKTLSLFEVNEFLSRVVALNFLEPIWVNAEIGQINFSREHCYLTLVEKSPDEDEIIAKTDAVIWANDLRRMLRKFKDAEHYILEQGSDVRLLVRADFHAKYGLKLLIEDIDTAYSLGKMAMARRVALLELQKLGLLDAQRKIVPPPVWQRIAVISSETAAGWIDFETHLKENFYGFAFQIQLFPAAMQGEQLENEVIQKLASIFAQKEQFDAVVIVRGGGSRVDLGGFDKVEIAKFIAKMPLPVLTGIGHQIDEALCDLVAFSAFKTPTAVADFLIQQNAIFEANLLGNQQLLLKNFEKSVQIEDNKLNRLEQFMKIFAKNEVKNQQKNLDFFDSMLRNEFKKNIRRNHQILTNLQKELALLDINATLARGFTLTRDAATGKIISDTGGVSKNAKIETVFKDGVVKSQVMD